jgi:hypothetical protein
VEETITATLNRTVSSGINGRHSPSFPSTAGTAAVLILTPRVFSLEDAGSYDKVRETT